MTRTYALYGATSRLLLAFLISLFSAQMAIMGIALAKSQSGSCDSSSLTQIKRCWWYYSVKASPRICRLYSDRLEWLLCRLLDSTTRYRLYHIHLDPMENPSIFATECEDTVSFVRTVSYPWLNSSRILHILRRDGILYFSVIFAANLLNVFLYSVRDGVSWLRAFCNKLF